MLWKKKDTALTVEDVVLRNTGLTKDEFLHPNKNPYIENIKEAGIFLKEAINNEQHITIFGDYDADGVTSTSILYRLIKEGFHYGDISVRFPKRFSEGYGLSMKGIDEISEGLLITVDNGIAAIEQIATAKAKGLSVLVLDHHLLNDKKEIPIADIVVDPNALPNSEFCGYCGAGLALKLAVECGVCTQELLLKLKTLAAIGTVADVMELVMDNRNIVLEGLEAMNHGYGPQGLNELLHLLGIEYVTETDIGFKIGPIINACGRLIDDGAFYPFCLLATEEYNEKLPQTLIDINEKRKIIVKDGIDAAERVIAENCLFGNNPLLIYKEKTFHEGVVGIIAGKIAEKFRVPVIVLTESEDPDVLKGSARSFGDFNLKAMLDNVSSLLVRYGGHAGAAGLSVRKNDIETLRSAMIEEVKKTGYDFNTENYFYDLEISPEDIPNQIVELQKFAPFGTGNPKVIYKVNNYKLLPREGKFFKQMGDGSIVKFFGNQTSAIAFGLFDKFEDLGEPMNLEMFGNLSVNRFNGKEELQIECLDIEKFTPQTQGNTLAELLKARMNNF